jgi:hypothetical protein
MHPVCGDSLKAGREQIGHDSRLLVDIEFF